ncbi:uncharacterized protein LOC130792348 [Actinidia eriantha]|uniref:uncharacterized protein LOC130792348 n=1 Tax=Actinidia eriantha TaxID=165200 RepID=UPI002587C0E8|nr:uncharacterized protein LOC130792348 [Actinidia eriantha]
MLVHYNQTSDILYYEALDIPLPELQGLKTLKVAFHHATKDEVIIHTIRLPKQNTVGDVINDLRTKVWLSQHFAICSFFLLHFKMMDGVLMHIFEHEKSHANSLLGHSVGESNAQFTEAQVVNQQTDRDNHELISGAGCNSSSMDDLESGRRCTFGMLDNFLASEELPEEYRDRGYPVQ